MLPEGNEQQRRTHSSPWWSRRPRCHLLPFSPIRFPRPRTLFLFPWDSSCLPRLHEEKCPCRLQIFLQIRPAFQVSWAHAPSPKHRRSENKTYLLKIHTFIFPSPPRVSSTLLIERENTEPVNLFGTLHFPVKTTRTTF